ncbi:LOW QUALITY PROTEIN: hypothetical protein BC938DRAFT_471231 [Jimgerdemannia flammicorona]|uniref:Uncharacterized protein n=1 Tax=Jimgerdemannia flammicorona TaxID=994334 RepID=A0A433Q8J8_9FUNG|nr:LOW QUALITY PROTEIN: hypothetical protein BC938DRAFT_471231 [Jimgerdemannia flammicorona]
MSVRRRSDSEMRGVLFGDGVVNVDVAVLDKAWLDVEVGETGQLELVGHGGLNVADGLVLRVVAAFAEREVAEPLVGTAHEDGDAAEVALAPLGRVRFDEVAEFGLPVVVVQTDLAANGDVENVTHEVRLVLQRGLAIGVGQRCITERLEDAIEGRHGARADGLLVVPVEQEGQVGDGGDTLGALGVAGDVLEQELPRDDERGNVEIIVDVEDLVSVVRATRVDLEGSQTDPFVLMVEEVGQDIEHVELGIDQVFDGVEAGSSVLDPATVHLLLNGRDENLLHLIDTLLPLELGQFLERGLEELIQRATDGGRVDGVKQHDDEGVLGANLGVGEYDARDFIGVVLELVAQGENNLLLALLAIEQDFDVVVVLHELGDDGVLVLLKPASKAIEDVQDGGQLVHKVVDVSLRLEVIAGKGFDDVAELLDREVVPVVSHFLVHLVQRQLELGREATRQGREYGPELRVRVAEDFHELADGGLGDGLVIVPLEDVLKHTLDLLEPLEGLVAADVGRPEGGRLAGERDSVLDASGVVEGEDTDDVAGVEGSTGLLDELDDAVLGGNEGHIHFHNFDLCVRLAGIDMLARFQQQADELARARATQLRGVVLLLELARLAVNHEPRAGHFLARVGRVALAIEQDE